MEYLSQNVGFIDGADGFLKRLFRNIDILRNKILKINEIEDRRKI